MSNSPPEYLAGSLVHLKSGGFSMTVSGYSNSEDIWFYDLIWCDSLGHMQRDTLPEHVLMPCCDDDDDCQEEGDICPFNDQE